MSRGLKEISTVIVRSNALTYGATEGGIRMLVMASGRTKDGSRERISTETLCCPGSRIYSLTGPECYTIPMNTSCYLIQYITLQHNLYFGLPN